MTEVTDEQEVKQPPAKAPEPRPEENVEPPPATPAKRPFYKRRGVLIIAGVVLLAGAILGVRYWLYARSHESTDDAFIDGHIIQVSPKAAGYIAKIHVDDNQQVKAGDLLVEIDPRDYEVRLRQAQAALDAGLAKENEAKRNVTLTRANTAATQAQVRAAQAEATRASADVERYRALYAKDEVSRQQLDQAIAAARTANAELESARQRVVASQAQVNEARAAQSAAAQSAQRARSQIGGAQAGVSEAIGRLAQANTAPQEVAVSEAQAATASASTEQLRAQLAQAELELSYTKIYAPEDGRVTRKSVEEGAQVQIGQPLLAIVPGEVWVTANYKESQIGRMTPGQAVEITVDAYPDKVFKGHVDSIQAGTGARFSLIPPENATGNYVKVVQRVPVKIVFDEPPDPKHMLAPGMSVVPEVAVR